MLCASIGTQRDAGSALLTGHLEHRSPQGLGTAVDQFTFINPVTTRLGDGHDNGLGAALLHRQLASLG